MEKLVAMLSEMKTKLTEHAHAFFTSVTEEVAKLRADVDGLEASTNAKFAELSDKMDALTSDLDAKIAAIVPVTPTPKPSPVIEPHPVLEGSGPTSPPDPVES